MLLLFAYLSITLFEFSHGVNMDPYYSGVTWSILYLDHHDHVTTLARQ